MKLNYKPIGEFIRQVKRKNSGGKITRLLGVNLDKKFISSVANIIGADMDNYLVINKGQFGCKLMSVGRDKHLPISLLQNFEEAIISLAYYVFEIVDKEKLLDDYLMMWLSRPESDRYLWFISGSDVRGGIGWDDFCTLPILVPTLEKQKKIVAEYNIIVNRIKLNEQLNQKLEETARAIYKQWFVDFEFPDENGKPYKSSGGKMEYNCKFECEIPKGWDFKKLSDITTKIGSGATPKGGKAGYRNNGIALVRSMNVFDFNFTFRNLAYIDKKQADKLSNVALKKNDVLLNITGVSVARCCKIPESVLPGRVNQHVAIIRLKAVCKAHNLLLCSLCSTEYRSKLLGISEGGSTRQALTKTDLEKTELLVPDCTTLNKFETVAEAIFKQKEELVLHNKYLDEFKELLLLSLATKNNVHK
ncbi:MAG: hypothetical protein WCQ87_01965 [Parabacteroides sp.]